MSPLQGRRYHFAGVGGSGMAPLALLTASLGARVSGSDRSFDRGLELPVFGHLRGGGVELTRQDGNAIHSALDAVIHSSAVEATNPEIVQADRLGVPRIRRGTFLARLARARRTVAVAGTSGKSTVTAMLAHIFVDAGFDPSFLGGAAAVALPGAVPPGSLRIGASDWLLVETDESDGSVAEFAPAFAILTNLSRDHKEIDVVAESFERLLAQTTECAILSAGESSLAKVRRPGSLPVVTCAFEDREHWTAPTRVARDLRLSAEGARFRIDTTAVTIPFPGRLSAENGLISLVAAEAAGISLQTAADAMERFPGVRRRLERIGVARGVEVYDDFGHNPVKIRAAIDALRPQGTLWVFYQPHGYGPTRFFAEALVETFAQSLRPGDRLLLAPIYDAGGTADRSLRSEDLIEALRRRGVQATLAASRDAAAQRIGTEADPGDRVVVMGARDDTLPGFASSLLAAIRARATPASAGGENRGS